MVLPLADSTTGSAAEKLVKKRGGGPKTAEGRRAASLNALKHGCRASVVLPAELAARAEQYLVTLTVELMPRNQTESWWLEQMARAMAQLDRCWELLLANQQRCINVAEFDWVSHRRTEVETLGSRLDKQPSRVAHALEQTEQGADWKIDRWQGFCAVLETTGTCDEGLHSLAFDLMGVPQVLRAGHYRVPAATDIPALLALARNQIERLETVRDTELTDREEFVRTMALSGMPCDEDAETAKLRRYEAMCRRELRWARSQFEKERNGSAAAGESAAPRAVSEPLASVPYQLQRTMSAMMSEVRSEWLPAMTSTPTQRAEATEYEDSAAIVPEVSAASVNREPKATTITAPPIPVAVAPGASVAARTPGLASPRVAGSTGRAAGPRNRRERRAAKARARKASSQRA